MIRITIIADNTAARSDLRTEHGFACWVEANGHRLLFDTGAGQVLRVNATTLGVPLEQAEAIALSHGHYDHTGGLPEVWTAPDTTSLYLHAGALANRYRVAATGVKVIGMPRPVRELLAHHMPSLRYTNQPTEIASGAWLTGFVPRHHHEEVAEPEPFFLDPCGQQPDHLVDDQALYLVTGSGVIVLLGCAHAGIINTLDYIRHLTGNAPLRAVIGGMHLRAASAARLAWTVAQLQRLNPGMLVPAHCTGAPATAALAAAFGGRYRPCGAGASFDFVNENQTTTQKEKHLC
jgi:7,8-dihydropterin-6-yl-methyl-4-(beta-D-ribofuranosyl)aminobenzene 5'-phosphate synthase